LQEKAEAVNQLVARSNRAGGATWFRNYSSIPCSKKYHTPQRRKSKLSSRMKHEKIAPTSHLINHLLLFGAFLSDYWTI